MQYYQIGLLTINGHENGMAGLLKRKGLRFGQKFDFFYLICVIKWSFFMLTLLSGCLSKHKNNHCTS